MTSIEPIVQESADGCEWRHTPSITTGGVSQASSPSIWPSPKGDFMSAIPHSRDINFVKVGAVSAFLVPESIVARRPCGGS